MVLSEASLNPSMGAKSSTVISEDIKGPQGGRIGPGEGATRSPVFWSSIGVKEEELIAPFPSY